MALNPIANLYTMKTNQDKKNRRGFIKSISLAVASVSLSPSITFGRSVPNSKISIGFSNTSLEETTKFSKVFSQNPDFIVSENPSNVFLHYLHSMPSSNLIKFGQEITNNTILVVNKQNTDDADLSYLKKICNTNRTFLLMIEENLQEASQVIFGKATLYEPCVCDTTKIENIIKSISFLNQLTQQNQFFIINQSLTLNNTII